MSKKKAKAISDYQKKFFDAWSEQMENVPGGEQFVEYQKQFFNAWSENMDKFPGVEQFSEYQQELIDNWNKQVESYPGGKQFVEYQKKVQKQLKEAQKQMGEYQKQAFETSKQYFDAWNEQIGKLPGMDVYKQAFEGMMPKAGNVFDVSYWKGFLEGMPGFGEYWKNVSNMMPDPAAFMSSWPYKIPGFDAAAKVFDLWKGASDPVSFARDYAEKYMDLMQDVFKGFLPEGALSYMQRPLDFMDTLVNYYQQNFAPLLKVDEKILKRIAQGDLKAYTELFRDFNARYEESIGKYYNMVGLGLNRESNEEYMKALSAYNKAMFATGELMSMIMTTSAESMTELAEAMKNAISEGKSLTTFREFYDLWSKTTEAELMKLLETDEFSKTFDNFADMYSQYMVANNKIVERMLSSLPIPTNTDMKSLYKTVYDLRKDVRDLKREVKALKTELSSRTTSKKK